MGRQTANSGSILRQLFATTERANTSKTLRAVDFAEQTKANHADSVVAEEKSLDPNNKDSISAENRKLLALLKVSSTHSIPPSRRWLNRGTVYTRGRGGIFC